MLCVFALLRSGGGHRGRFRKRRFKPEKNIFGGAWAAIYLVMGLASWLVWRQGGLWAQFTPLCLYLCQLGVNLFAWPPIFVGAGRRRYAVADSAGKSIFTMPHGTCPAQSPYPAPLWDTGPPIPLRCSGSLFLGCVSYRLLTALLVSTAKTCKLLDCFVHSVVAHALRFTAALLASSDFQPKLHVQSLWVTRCHIHHHTYYEVHASCLLQLQLCWAFR